MKIENVVRIYLVCNGKSNSFEPEILTNMIDDEIEYVRHNQVASGTALLFWRSVQLSPNFTIGYLSP